VSGSRCPRDRDAAGLSLFAVTGAAKTLEFGLNSLSAVILGAITGVGGGTIRDILLDEVPAILRVDVYAVAAVCLALRIGAIAGHWNLPRAT
jgi:uncharacterized membrane protein YeiH